MFLVEQGVPKVRIETEDELDAAAQRNRPCHYSTAGYSSGPKSKPKGLAISAEIGHRLLNTIPNKTFLALQEQAEQRA